MRKALFIDRDGTLIVEPPITEQVNSIDELEFLPHVIGSLAFIAKHLDYELVMVTNQDGLGTENYPEAVFQPIQDAMLRTLVSEGIHFKDILIDRTYEKDNAPTRKPNTGMLTDYLSGDYDLSACYVIGDRLTDVQLAKNLGCKAILLTEPTPSASSQSVSSPSMPSASMPSASSASPASSTFSASSAPSTSVVAELNDKGLQDSCALVTDSWPRIADYLFAGERTAQVHRVTKETDIRVQLDLDGKGECHINTGIGFFDHMLEQIGRHGGIDLDIRVRGDLHIDEHHTIEDTAIVLGQALYQALGSKRGIERYGYTLPMDDCLCSVVLDFGGRPWLVWEADFKRESIGDLPTEMFMHFFKSLSDEARMNLYIKAEGTNEHHKIEGIFKALGRSLRMAIRRDIYRYELPSSKGTL